MALIGVPGRNERRKQTEIARKVNTTSVSLPEGDLLKLVQLRRVDDIGGFVVGNIFLLPS
jgi:hypothetical protein